MTLKETIEFLEQDFIKHTAINSVGHGEVEAIDTSKVGVLYQRAYIHVVSATPRAVNLEIRAIDLPKADLSDVLDIQSKTLTTIREIAQRLIHHDVLPFSFDDEFDTIYLEGTDAHIGWKFTVEIRDGQIVDACETFNT